MTVVVVMVVVAAMLGGMGVRTRLCNTKNYSPIREETLTPEHPGGDTVMWIYVVL